MSSLSSQDRDDAALASPHRIYVASSSEEMQSDDNLRPNIVGREVHIQRVTRTKIEQSRRHETSFDEDHGRYEASPISAPVKQPTGNKTLTAPRSYTRVVERNVISEKSSRRTKGVGSDDEEILAAMQQRQLRDGEDQEFKHKEVVVAALPPHATLRVRDILQKGIDFGFQTEDLRFITIPSPPGTEIGCGCDLFWRPEEKRPYGGIDFLVRSKAAPSPPGVDKCVGCGAHPRLRLTVHNSDDAARKTTNDSKVDTQSPPAGGRYSTRTSRKLREDKVPASGYSKPAGVDTSTGGGTLAF